MNRSFLLHPERQVSQRHDERTPATRGPEGEFCAGGTLDQYTASAMLAPAAGLSRRTEMSTQLQQKVGNQAVRHLIGTRLSLSSSGNVEEFEADQVAARAAFTSERGRGQSDHVAGPPKGLAGLLHRAVDTAPARPAARLAHEAVPREGGRSMDAGIMAVMEAAFGGSFADVRIHTEPEAASTAAALRSRAYTVGRDVVFALGEYQPQTSTGQRLLAHEMAHVIQQSRGGQSPELSSDHELERAADAAAGGFSRASGPIAVAGSAGPGIARQSLDRQTQQAPLWQMPSLDLNAESMEQEYQTRSFWLKDENNKSHPKYAAVQDVTAELWAIGYGQKGRTTNESAPPPNTGQPADTHAAAPPISTTRYGPLWQTPPLILAGEALEREYWIRFDWLKENKNHEKSIDVLKVLIDLWKLGCGRKTPMSTGNNQRTHLINAIIERKPDLTAFTANIKSSEQDNILPPDQSTLGMLIPLLKPFNIVPSGPMPFDSSFPKIPGEGFGSGLQTAETIAEKVGETAAETIAEKMEETVVKQAAQRLVRPLLLPKSLSILGGLALAAATIYVLTRDTSDTGPDASEIELPAAGPLDEEISDPSDSYLIEAPSADSGVPIEAPGAAGKLPAEAPGLRSDPLSLDTWRPEPTLKNAHWGPAPPGGEAGSDYARQVTGSDESVYVTDLHKELKEFQGPKGLGKVEFDGLRNGTLLDAKDWSVGTFFQKGANEILLQAYRQGHALNKSGAKGIEWHCSNVDVAAKIRELFENHGVTIRVIWTPKK